MSLPWKGIFLFISIAVTGSLHCYGQNDFYIFRNINTSDGLGSDIVTSITQDNKGFMWIATTNGLQKYDGNSFTSYHHDPYDSQSISSDNTGFLLKDPEDNIWVSTSFLGFNIFNSSTGKSTRVSAFKDSSFRNLEYSTGACLDTQGNVWLISIGTIAKYDIGRHQLVSYDYLLPKNITIGMTKSILCDPRTGNLWINSYGYGICMFDPKRNIFYHNTRNPENLPVFNLERPGTLCLDKENNLWVNTYSGKLYRYNVITHQIREFFFKDPLDKAGKATEVYIDCMMQDRNGTIWMGARKYGLLEYLPKSGTFRSISRNVQAPGDLNYNEYILCLSEDREGNIWIGTDKGILIFNPNRQQFHSVNLPRAKNGALKTTSVASLFQTKKNDIWAATYGQGVHVFDEHLQYKKTYSYEANRLRAFGEPTNRVWSFLSQADGKVFIGSQHGWLSIFDPKSENFISTQPAAMKNNTIISMVLDSSQNTWFALYSGIAKWDPKKNSFTKYPDLMSYHGNSQKQVFDILVDKQQNLWVASQTNGLQKFETAVNRFTKMYVPEKNNPHSLSDISVQCIAKINDSLFALGTSSGGINIFNSHTEQFSYITTREGLPDNNISALYFQAPHDLWVASGQGLSRVDLESKRAFQYGLEDGIFNNDFSNCLRFYKTTDGHLMAGYDGGFVSFIPDSIGRTNYPANVTITGFKIYDRPLLVDSLFIKSDTIALSYQQNFITIEFASLSFLGSHQINYYYQLQGVDKDWVRAGKRRFVEYANLSPGPYPFYIKCENRDGAPCKKITSVWLIIYPPFWQTGWFRFLLVAITAALLYGLYRYKINQLLKVLAMRSGISKDLHDDLGATLGSINILSEVAISKIESGEQEQTHSLLTKISSHSREMVEKMSDIVWAINPKNESVEKIIQRLANFGQETCASKDIQLEFRTDETTLKRVLHMDTMKNIYLIMKEAMNNAIKHSGCRHLTISIKTVPGGLDISIADDGSGFDPAIIKNGNGLINMEYRAKEMKGSMAIHSVNKNTRVALLVPIT